MQILIHNNKNNKLLSIDISHNVHESLELI